MTDIDHKRRVAADLEAGNERSYEEIREATSGRFTMDTSDLRRELFFKKLVEWGIVTEEQMLDYDIEFHKQVEEALSDSWAKLREAQAQPKKKLSVVQKPAPKLLGADGKPIGG